MNEFICKECGREFGSLVGLSLHIFQVHKMKREEYYLKYINPEKGKCIECGNDVSFVNLRDGYKKYCSTKCSANSNEVRNKYKKTCMKNFGCEYPYQNEKIKNKTKETCMKNFGVEHSMQSEEVKNKAKITWFKKYGCENPNQNEEVQNKRKDTCMKKYGCEYSLQNEEVQNKRKDTCMKNLGCEYSLQNEEVQNKRKDTCMKNLGYENPMQNKDIRNKQKETCKKNFGYEHPMQNSEISGKNRLIFEKVQERYPDLVTCEELIPGPNGEILGHCKNSNCKNSQENGGYFKLTAGQVQLRNIGINSVKDLNYLYCCEECKQECPLYHRSAFALINLTSENPEFLYTQQEYSTFKNEVLSRQLLENKEHTLNYCEKCHATEDLHVHHIQPQKLEPGYALDPPNGLILCQKCHFEIGHEKGTECSTGNLANKICKN